jgi:transposase
MISVGIDVSKGKSAVCVLKPEGEVVRMPFEVEHTREALDGLAAELTGLEGEVRAVCEATGIYHLPVIQRLVAAGLFICAANPLAIKKFGDESLRKVKTDSADAIKIARYGLERWDRLVEYSARDAVYAELRELGSQYEFHMGGHVRAKVNLSNLLERTMPGITSAVSHQSDLSGDDKLGAIVQRYWHYDNITRINEKRFVADFCKWAKKQGYQRNEETARRIYALALSGIPVLPSEAASTKMLVTEAVGALLETNRVLQGILSQMTALASTLPEYKVLMAMPGVGKVLAPRIIAAIGDIRRYRSAKALVAFAGVDVSVYQSGQFTGSRRKITKRGSKTIRRVVYLLMSSLNRVKPSKDSAVYDFMCKKLAEGKPKKVAKVAGINKFLHIYFARVSALYT